MSLIRRAALLGALSLAAAACSPSPPSPPRPTAPPKATTPPKAAASPGASPVAAQMRLGELVYNNHGEREVRGRGTQDVDAGDYYFRGTFLRGTPGQRLRLRIRNVAQVTHNISLPSQQVDRDLPTGGERTDVEVTFPASGALRFFCKLHADHGMNGQLLVGDAEPQPLTSLVLPSDS